MCWFGGYPVLVSCPLALFLGLALWRWCLALPLSALLESAMSSLFPASAPVGSFVALAGFVDGDVGSVCSPVFSSFSAAAAWVPPVSVRGGGVWVVSPVYVLAASGWVFVGE